MRRFVSPRWMFLHVTTVVLIIVFLRLGLWQYHRAGSGNSLSWGYTVEWPFFAGCVAFTWYKMLRAELEPRDERGPHMAAPDSEGRDDGTPPSAVQAVGAAAPESPPRVPFREVPVYSPDGEQDEELAAYNAYLARLNARRG